MIAFWNYNKNDEIVKFADWSLSYWFILNFIVQYNLTMDHFVLCILSCLVISYWWIPPSLKQQSSKIESVENSPVTPPLTTERLPRNLYRPIGAGVSYSSSDSLEYQPMQYRQYQDSGLTSTPKLSSISGAKTETSSIDASMRSSSSRDADRSGELSISNASDLESEWVEQDEPGVYITIRALPGGKRELRRVRFRY